MKVPYAQLLNACQGVYHKSEVYKNIRVGELTYSEEVVNGEFTTASTWLE